MTDFYELLHRYFDDDCTAEEREQLLQQVERDPALQQAMQAEFSIHRMLVEDAYGIAPTIPVLQTSHRESVLPATSFVSRWLGMATVFFCMLLPGSGITRHNGVHSSITPNVPVPTPIAVQASLRTSALPAVPSSAPRTVAPEAITEQAGTAFVPVLPSPGPHTDGHMLQAPSSIQVFSHIPSDGMKGPDRGLLVHASLASSRRAAIGWDVTSDIRLELAATVTSVSTVSTVMKNGHLASQSGSATVPSFLLGASMGFSGGVFDALPRTRGIAYIGGSSIGPTAMVAVETEIWHMGTLDITAGVGAQAFAYRTADGWQATVSAIPYLGLTLPIP